MKTENGNIIRTGRLTIDEELKRYDSEGCSSSEKRRPRQSKQEQEESAHQESEGDGQGGD